MTGAAVRVRARAAIKQGREDRARNTLLTLHAPKVQYGTVPCSERARVIEIQAVRGYGYAYGYKIPTATTLPRPGTVLGRPPAPQPHALAACRYYR